MLLAAGQGGGGQKKAKDKSAAARRPASEENGHDRSMTIVNRVLEAAGPRPSRRQLMNALLEQSRDWTGCEAAGIRLEEAGDYPLVATQGYPAEFVRADNHLCSYGPDGSRLVDAEGRPALDCICGDVIRGRLDPDRPYFTTGGSFWSGSMTEFTAEAGGAEHFDRVRTHCHTAGYESVALIPLRADGEAYGLLQLGGTRTCRFTPEVMATLEPAVAVIATLLKERIAVEDLSVGQTQYRALLDAVSEAFAYCRLVYDAEGRPCDWIFVAANDAFRALVGFADVEGKSANELMPGIHQSRPEMLETCARVVATGEPERLESRPPGSDLWLDVRVSSPGPDCFLTTFDDITERKRLEESLRVTQLSVEESPDPIHWVDSDGRLTYFNKSYVELSGHSPEEIRAQRIWDTDPTLTRERFLERWRQGKTGPLHHEATLRSKDGREYALDVTSTSVEVGGKRTGISFMRDITERKAAEERLRRTQYALDHMADYPLWADVEGRIVEVSESTCRQLEYSREELLGMTVFDIDPSLSREEWSRHWDEGRMRGDTVVEAHHRKRSGGSIPVEIASAHVTFGGTEYECAFCRDITERKRLERSLRVTQYAVDQAQDMIYWLNPDGVFVYANEAACRAVGYSLEELRTMHPWDLDPTTNAGMWPDEWRTIKEAGARTFETIDRTRDGRIYPVEVFSQHLEFEGEEFGVSVNRDISERKAAEQSLKDSEERYRLLFELETDAHLLLDDETYRILDANQATVALYGYSHDELLGMTILDLSTDPEATELAVEEEIIDVPLRWHRKKDGTIFPIEAHGRRFDWQGRPVHMVAIRDITERRRIEESLHLTQLSVDRAPDMVHWVDADGRLVYINQAVADFLGYTLEESQSLYLWDIAPETREDFFARWSDGLGKPPFVHEGALKAKDGRLLPVEVTSNTVELEGKVIAVHLARDISERKAAEQSLRDSEERYRLLFELETDAHMLLDDETQRIMEANEAAIALYGYSQAELLGMTIFDLSTDPEQTRLSGKNTLIDVPLRWHRKKDGTVFPIEAHGRHFEWRGRPVHMVAIRDITDRRRTEESLLLTQRTVDQAPDVVHWSDEEGRIVYANQAFMDLFGYTREEIKELHLWDIDKDLTPEFYVEKWPEGRGRGTLSHEATLTAKDGTPIAVEVSSNVVTLEGRELGVHFLRDIRERKAAAQSLRDSEERYHQLFELESDALVLWDDESRAILDVNEAAVSLYGYTRAELLTMKDTDLFTEPQRSESTVRAPVFDAHVYRDRRKDGTIFPVEARGRRFEWKGRAVHVVAVRDITSRIRAEEQLEESRQMLRLVLDTVPLRISWRDRDLRYLGCNTAAALDAHLSDTSAIVGLTEKDLFFASAGELHADDDREVMASGTPKLQYEETAASATGAARVLRTSKVPLRDRAGQVFGVLSVQEDVTERTQTLRALKERDEQLRQSQKMEAIGRLAGGIAHDFNNVLTTIMGYSDLILSAPESASQSLLEDVTEIKNAAERAAGLTRQILAFSRRQALQPQVLSLNSIISDIERLLARTMGADVELKTELGEDLGLVEVDEHQFVQVMLNLAVNARDAMPRGGTFLVETRNVQLDDEFCQTHPDAHPGNYVMLAVSDTGIGMDADTAAHVFEPFYTTKAPGLGTGLGLATVYGVVTQSGGCIDVRTALGRGATFSIYLPRFDHPPVETGQPIPEEQTAPARETILLVDDDATFRNLTVRMLEKRGYRVLPASDGDQAVALLESKDSPIHLLLTNVVLPGSLQGNQIAEVAATLRPGLPVLYMSAYTRDAIVHAGRLEETLDYLEKPFTAESLARRVQECLGSG